MLALGRGSGLLGLGDLGHVLVVGRGSVRDLDVLGRLFLSRAHDDVSVVGVVVWSNGCKDGLVEQGSGIHYYYKRKVSTPKWKDNFVFPYLVAAEQLWPAGKKK